MASVAPPQPSRTTRIVFALGIAALVCAAFLVASLLGAIRASDANRLLVTRANEERRQVYFLQQSATDMETGLRGYLLTGDRAFLEPFTEGSRRADATLARLRELAPAEAGPSGGAQLARLAAITRAQRDAFNLQIAARDRAGQRLQNDLLSNKAMMDSFREEIRALLESINARYEASRTLRFAAVGDVQWIALVLGALSLATAALALWTLTRERRAWRANAAAMQAANDALAIARAEAEASDESKTRFLAMASHDLRQPLHALSLYIAALQRRVVEPETKKILGNMDRATHSMINMFASLLDLARIQSGVTRPDIEDVAVQDCFEHVTAEFGGHAVEIVATDIFVRSDRRLIESALRNLVGNALKHGGGWARIEVEAHPRGALLCVTDRGPGVPADRIDDIFREFTRLESTKTEGLGLGLAIVKRIADMLDAEIVVRSQLGRGSTFGLVCPITRGVARQRAPAAMDPARTLAGISAIVIDDEDFALQAAAQMLRDAGAIVATGASVDDLDALIAAAATPPHLLVMDLRLQGELRGVFAANAARARLDPPPGVVMVTGDTGPETLAMLRASGFAWLIKPATPADFLSAASAVLERQAAGANLN